MSRGETRAGWLGPQEAAAILGISVAELLERASEGRIADAVLNVSGWQFRRREIQRLAAVRAAEAAT